MDPKDSKSRKRFEQILASLNESQQESVLSNANILQILAGPGTGKTKVLTSRIAYFVIERRIPPKQIVVVTFTSKAANEMKNRLKDLIGAEQSNALFIGTFHTLCCRILHSHASHVELEPNFSVADVAASKDIFIKVRRNPQIIISDFIRRQATINEIWGFISESKNKGVTCSTYSELYGQYWDTEDIAVLYNYYEAELKNLNFVDFDNLLIKTCELLRKKKDVLSNIKAIFVDEFQDTNVVQYELLKLMTMQDNNKEVTIVGDPDQSIYGFRNAEHLDFKNLQKDFFNIRELYMEENYRSTETILKAVHHVISQVSNRFNKPQRTNKPDGLPIFLISTENEETQAEFVAKEIQNVVNQSMGLISYKDIAVLMRKSSISPQFENVFRDYNIPFTKFGGDRFFDRAEVKDILSYLKFAYNPKDSFSFKRIVNVPRRCIGSTTMKKIMYRSAMDETDLLETIMEIGYDRSSVLFSFPIKSKLLELGSICSTLKEMMTRQENVAQMIRYLTEAVCYKEYLIESNFVDHEARWNNIVELISLAQKIDFTSSDEGAESPSYKGNASFQLNDLADNDDLPKTSSIIEFLENCTLCSNQKEMEEAEGGKVALSTLHSAKGLEWPCVFIVTCNDGVIPPFSSVSTNGVEEECRLFYVGITRSKFLMYCVTPITRRDYHGTIIFLRECRFLNGMDKSIYSLKAPVWDDQTRAMIYETIGKKTSVSPDDSTTPSTPKKMKLNDK